MHLGPQGCLSHTRYAYYALPFLNRRYEKTTMNPNAYRRKVEELLEEADVCIGGDRPWDVAVHDDRFFAHVLGHGSLGAGESYMDRWWDCPQLDELCVRVLGCRVGSKVARSAPASAPSQGTSAQPANARPLLPRRPASLRQRERSVPGYPRPAHDLQLRLASALLAQRDQRVLRSAAITMSTGG